MYVALGVAEGRTQAPMGAGTTAAHTQAKEVVAITTLISRCLLKPLRAAVGGETEAVVAAANLLSLAALRNQIGESSHPNAGALPNTKESFRI